MANKRILVTGASSGIGRAICLRLAASGADIAACGSSHAGELERLIEELRALGVKAFPLLGNLSDPTVPARLVNDAAAAMGGLDAVVSNAGITRPASLTDLTPDDWDLVFSVNVRAPWLLAAAAHPWLKLERGAFVAVASMSGMQPYSGMGAYSPSKSALIMLVRQLAQEWAANGIRVNSVSPGLVRTPLSQAVYDVPEAKSAREALIPLHRIAEADADMAGIVAFLLSREAGYITGQNILADGGLLDSIQTHIVGRPRSGGGNRHD
ncbi:MAG: SDR family oxidoreductase [Desulfuromonadaceae bacterium]